MRTNKRDLEEKLNEIRKEVLILETLGIKPNYLELSRIYKIDRRTIQKYKDGYKIIKKI